MFEFLLSDDFLSDLKKLDKKIQAQIKEKLLFFGEQENALFYAKKLKGEKDIFRFRVGDYRTIFLLKNNQIILLRIGNRREVCGKK